MAGRRGPTRREEMIMTQDKARKAATRQRMAETGEPYRVARHAVETEAADQSATEPAPAERASEEADHAEELACEADSDAADAEHDGEEDHAGEFGGWPRHRGRRVHPRRGPWGGPGPQRPWRPGPPDPMDPPDPPDPPEPPEPFGPGYWMPARVG